MGLRYRKSMNLGPFRLNFSKSGVGYSYGVKGYRVTHTANGKVRTTTSIPGTGVSHVSEVSEAQYRRQQERKQRERKEAAKNGMPLFAKVVMGGLLLLCLAFVFAGCSADEPVEVPPMTPQEAIAMVEGTRAPTEPTPAPTPESDPEPAPKPEPTQSKTEPAPAPTEPAPEPETEPATQPPTEPEPEPTEPAQQTVAYIGNKNSKKLHETWCDSVNKMKESNKVEFSSRDAAIGLGYEPCQNCNP